jgi:catechol 2,3 dioxygenase
MTMYNQPRRNLLSQLAHVELLTPCRDESAAYFHDLLGMEISATEGDSVYLRGWGEYFHHSLKLTQSPLPGLGHFSYRTTSAAALETLAAEIEASGRGEGWIDGDVGHGRAYRFTLPEGHLGEIFWDVERIEVPPEERSIITSRAQRYIMRGVPARRLHHVTLFAADCKTSREFLQDTVSLITTELVRFDGTEHELIVMMTANVQDHDMGLSWDPHGATAPGRFNHIAFWYDTREEIGRVADLCFDYRHPMEFGPTRHGGTELYFMYVTEPGGNRVELCTGGYVMYEPDRPIFEHLASNGGAVMWGNPFPQEMHGLGTPMVDPKTGLVIDPDPVPATA